ncbi:MULTISPECIES: hypothetical protein [unclassified Pseudomonas]|uniref:hypothetical protein n=1 Tax=unclassified Pseudomonas TaxID=196821 RepID=UPI00244C6437|nr:MULTISPECIES: hypothetical protein [unclassified Pseudomonas]MDH0300500.1 hypothetical protein [Pseudomonas sp. GD04091]MDH1987957.1 hypothetical protein [Pseudomonas sp. GD03689]
MSSIIKFGAVVVLALPFFAHAEDGAQAAKRFHDHNRAVFAQQIKDRAAREQRELESSRALMEKASGNNKTGHERIAK